MKIRILGSLEVEENGRTVDVGGARQRALLTILVLHRGTVVSADRLIDDLYGGRAPPTASKTLQAHISRLRKALGDGNGLQTRAAGYTLDRATVFVDADRFTDLVQSGRAALAAGRPREASDVLEAALGLWRGPPLDDVRYQDFAQPEIARLEELRLGAIDDLIDARLALGRHAEVLGELERLVAKHPLRERPRAQLMLALYRSGRQGDALAVYQSGRRTMVEELGLEPGRGLQDMERAILRQDPTLDAAVAPEPVAVEPPRPGRGGVGAFVGRDEELSDLISALDDAKAGSGQLVVLSGEAGIGKSRLAEELALEAKARGTSVLWGRCWEAGGAPAYWPWVQALRTHVRGVDPDRLRRELGSGISDLGQLLPELRDIYPDVPEPRESESDGARFRLFDSTATFLRNAAEATPLLLVLDDLHVADPSSLLMLRFVASGIAEARMTLVAIFRNPDLERQSGDGEALFELGRKASVQITLGGLSEPDVASYIDRAAHVTAEQTVIEAIFRETEGNPLFVGEIVRLLAEEGRLDRRPDASWRLSVPTGVREVIGRRLKRLSPGCTDVLVLASVLGREFRLDALERLSGRGACGLLELIDEAVGERVVASAEGMPPRLRFAHALIRDALYESLPPSRRIELHRLAGEALEDMYAADLEPHLTELAHHFLAAAPAGDAAKAIDLAHRAGDRASRLLAREEAARLYELALSALPLDRGADDVLECRLQLALGRARAGAGEMADARVAFLRAAELARRQDDAERLARAALGYSGQMVWGRAGGDPIVVPLLEEAVAGLGDEITVLRARLLARLGGALRDEPDPTRREEVGELAVSVARETGDPSALVYALHGLLIGLQASPDLERRLAIAAELARLAHEVDDKEGQFDAGSAEQMIYFELGRLDLVKERAAREQRLAEAMRLTPYLWAAAAMQVMLALHDGRFAEAEVFLSRSLELGLRSQETMAEAAYALQLYQLRREQGRAQEADVLLTRAAGENPARPLFSCSLARLAIDLGRQVEARRLFGHLAEDEFRAVPRDQEWLLAMSFLADVCWSLNDTARAALLYDQLLPYADRIAADVHEGSGGAVARSLGLLAAVLGRMPDASRHLEAAIELNLATGALPWATHSRVELANVLIGEGDRARARGLLEEARNAARTLGMSALVERATTMLVRAR